MLPPMVDRINSVGSSGNSTVGVAVGDSGVIPEDVPVGNVAADVPVDVGVAVVVVGRGIAIVAVALALWVPPVAGLVVVDEVQAASPSSRVIPIHQ